jgi:L-ascorbate metabolism protein UlaG (beta-lactamase superfamily)
MIRNDFRHNIHWLGHDGFRLDGLCTVYIDPFNISGGPEADIILISHEHFDHCSPADVSKIQGESTVIVTEKDSAKKLKGDIRIVKPEESIVVKGITIETVFAYNTDKDFHPKKNGWLGFVIDMEGTRIYHAGDTDFIPEMKDLNVDIALLPVSGTYVMTAEEAVKAALAIKPDLAVPMHYGAIVGDKEDALRFKKELEGKVNVFIPGKE